MVVNYNYGHIACSSYRSGNLKKKYTGSNHSSVGIATDYTLDDRMIRVRFPAEAGNFSLRPALGHTQPPNQWVPVSPSLEVKRPGREADHSPPSSAEGKECVELYLHSPIRLHGVMLSEAQGQLYLYLTFTNQGIRSSPVFFPLK
jgi:hypothetical protein